MREEEDLRAALRTLERHTPDPDKMLAAIRASAGPAAPPGPPRRPRRSPPSWPGSWSGWITPLAAAAAVVAVVATSILVAKVYVPVRPGGPRPHRVSTVAPPFPTWDGLPAYFLATAGMLNSNTPGTAQFNRLIPSSLRAHDTVGIISTATGKVAATVRLPGHVSVIAASAGAFFAAVVSNHVTTFYEIRLAAGGAGARTTKLPIPLVTAQIGYLAAAPDGSKLAISIEVPRGHSAYLAQNLTVAATATGAERQWTTPVPDRSGGIGAMSWLADGRTLAFDWFTTSETSSAALRLLDTAAGGHDLLGGRAVLPMANDGSYFNGYTVSPDGRVLVGAVLCVAGGCRPGSPGALHGRRLIVGSIAQFRAASGKASVRYVEPELPGMAGRQRNSGCYPPLWIGSSASRMLLLCFQHRTATRTRRGVIDAHVVLLSGGLVTQLPWLTAAVNEYTAFPGVTAYNNVPGFPW